MLMIGLATLCTKVPVNITVLCVSDKIKVNSVPKSQCRPIYVLEDSMAAFQILAVCSPETTKTCASQPKVML